MLSRDDLTWTRAEIDAANAAGVIARAEFDETLNALRTGLTGLDPLEVLARAALSLTMRIATMESKPDQKGLEIFHVEILQALALSGERRIAAIGDFPATTQASIELIDRNGQAYRGLWLRKIGTDPVLNQREELIALLQSWTMAIRGPRHAHQTQEFLRAMCAGVDDAFRQEFGCRPSAIVAVLNGLIDMLGSRIRQHMDWLKGWMPKKSGVAMIEGYVRGLSDAEAEDIQANLLPHRHDRKGVFNYLWNLSESRFAPLMHFTTDELAAIAPGENTECLRAVLDSLALEFEDVSVKDLEHLHLSNPVQLKPLIHLDKDQFFCCNPHSLGTNLAEIFEELCGRFPSTKTRLEDVRADWLEKKLRGLIGMHLPAADTHRSVKWKDLEDGKIWESDVVAVIDKTVLIFEAKSGKISGPARRGALNSLKGALKDLVVEPSDQSARLKRYIEQANGVLHFKTDEGELLIDAGDVRDVIRVNVVMDAIGPLSAHWPQLKAAGLIPTAADIAPTMTVFELETVFEVLQLQIERCHYLSRRSQFEKEFRYTADELDLLAYYLETQFNVRPQEPDSTLWLYGRSMQIASAYSAMRATGMLNFPIRRTQLWRRLLAALEDKKPSGWTRFGYRLLNATPDGQRTLEQRVKAGRKAVAKAPGRFFTSAVTFGQGKRRNTIAFAIGAPHGSEELQQQIQHASNTAFEQGGSSDLLLLYWFSPATGEAYDFIGTMRQARLSGWT
ncbi:hypothetical protein O6027_19900 [Sphingomonas aerolata]|uniref:hypothetical protein n=1 Tax=Sphingomonas aerolata TaxID=185951 RepID=UPI0033462929